MAQAPPTRKKPFGINLFKIHGIQIAVDYSWFIIFFLILWSLSAGYFPKAYPGAQRSAYWAAGVIASILFFSSVLIHELAHSLTAIRQGIKIPSITLFIFGGISQLSEEAKTPEKELKIAIAGPLSSIVLGFVFYGIKLALQHVGLYPMVVAVFGYLSWVNFALGIFNLFPGFPLDGGRVLRAFWWWRKGSLAKATKLASDMGKGFAYGLMFLGALEVFSGGLVGGLWFLFIGLFLRSVAEGGYRELVMRQSLEGIRVKEIMIEDVVSVPADITLERLVSSYFLHHTFRGYPVVSDGRPVGIVSIFDIKDIPPETQKVRTVREAMTPISQDITVSEDDSLLEALNKMSATGASRLLVLRAGKVTGMVTKTGLMRFLEIKKILGQ